MPVVISEFEAVAEAPPQQRGDEDAAKKGDSHDKPEPEDVKPVLRALETRALRAWAH